MPELCLASLSRPDEKELIAAWGGEEREKESSGDQIRRKNERVRNEMRSDRESKPRKKEKQASE